MTNPASALWAQGNYERVAVHFRSAAAKVIEAAGIESGHKVLDVACGTGNATIPAAQTGAGVTGLDITPGLLERARAAAESAGAEIEFVEGDAGAMPFEDGSFDRVISVFGCMFVPDHRQAAAELARVLADGGQLAVLAWTTEGVNGKMFTVCAPHMPPPPEGFQPPILWGDEDHVREIFDGTGVEISFSRDAVVMELPSMDEAMRWLEEDVPPVAAARAGLEPQGKWDALREDLAKLYSDEAKHHDDGSVSLEAEYLIISGVKAG
jgi:ubiquinone/menaquinone biosynthesis C-methylase UbiE